MRYDPVLMALFVQLQAGLGGRYMTTVHTIHILGIESSCDETAAAVVSAEFERDSAVVSPEFAHDPAIESADELAPDSAAAGFKQVRASGEEQEVLQSFVSASNFTNSKIISKVLRKKILSNVIYSQISEHERFKGVVPEIAARAHLEKIDVVVKKALEDANMKISDLSAVAGTCGPGLIGGVIVGATFAKGISLASGIPFIAVNHIEAHALTVRLTEEDVKFPYLLILASGGHCQICIVHSCDDFEIIGKTLDDSLGESFDKVAKMLGLGYPGGPALEKYAEKGDEKSFILPKPMCNRNSMDFSFSGLKTAVRVLTEKQLKKEDELDEQFKADISASFQRTVTDILIYKMCSALKYCENRGIRPNVVAISGGVAANKYIREKLRDVCEQNKMRFVVPPIKLCTDNGAMIAWMGAEKFAKGETSQIDFRPRPRWQCGQQN